ncbi:hypothetical protein GCM10010361_43480 [Streptomyces olivaceiscleroticus]|uniref:Uncharacterized protein n=1 Tax=Streptomyces olivaceiscleroticus TaxID=68245 RepID=A0ABN1AEB6_9ACTN
MQDHSDTPKKTEPTNLLSHPLCSAPNPSHPPPHREKRLSNRIPEAREGPRARARTPVPQKSSGRVTRLAAFRGPLPPPPPSLR